MTYYYFYKITNNINEKYYYGVHYTDNLDDGYMGSGKILHYAYKKYGKSNFTKTILKYFSNKEDMFKYEAEIVNEELLKDPNCYNLKCGGTGGGQKGIKRSKETKERMSKAHKGQSPSQEQRKQISNTLKGKSTWNKDKRGIYTDIQLEKISNAMQDRIWIHNEFESKFIKSSELQKYQENGYKLGRLKYKNKIIK